jgi:hypothetical protein
MTKQLTAILGILFVFATAHAGTERHAKIRVSWDRDRNAPITKDMTIIDSADSSSATLQIEGERLNPAVRDGNTISAYVSVPKLYFYYVLNTQPGLNNVGRVILAQSGTRTLSCADGSNALLTAYKGDGTIATFCVVIAQ